MQLERSRNVSRFPKLLTIAGARVDFSALPLRKPPKRQSVVCFGIHEVVLSGSFAEALDDSVTQEIQKVVERQTAEDGSHLGEHG